MTATGKGNGDVRRGRGARRLAGAAAGVMLLALAACDSAEERASEHLDNALAFIEEGDTVKAKLELRNALRLNEKLAPAHLEFAKILEDEGRLQQALNRYRTVTELDESLYEGHLGYGRILLAANELEQALRASNAAFQLAPDDVEVLTLKAATAFRLGNHDTARETLDRAFALDGDNPQLWLLEAALRRDGPSASREAREAAAEDPGADALAAAGTGADPQEVRGLEESLRATEEGLARAPDDLALALARISLLVRLERPDAARAALAETVERHPENVSLREALVAEQMRLGKIEAAEANLRGLAELEPENAERALDIVRLVLRTRGIEAGLEELDRMIAEAGSPEAAWPFVRAKAGLMIDNGRADEAVVLLERSIEEVGVNRFANEARVVLARLALMRGEEAELRRRLEEVLANDETDADALAMRARLAIRDNDYDAAITDLRKAVRESPENVEVLQLLAAAHRRNGNRQLAGERLADAVEASGHATEPVLAYVNYLSREGKMPFAVQIVREALDKRPDDKDLLRALATMHLRSGNFIEAEEIGNRLKALDSTDTVGPEVLAAARMAQEDFEGGLRALTETGAAAPERDLRTMVVAYARAGREDEARKLIEARLAADPEDPEAVRMKGVVQLSDGDMEGALETLETSIALAPSDPAGYIAVSRVRTAMRDIDGAQQILAEGIERTGSDGLRMALAILEERRGNPDRAIELYRVILENQPGFDIAANNFASLLSDSDPTEAEIEEAYTAAKRLRGSQVPQFQDTYGWLLHLRGETGEALSVLEKAAEGLPSHPVVLYHLGAVLADLGQTTRAREVLARAVEAAGDRTIPQVTKAESLLAGLPAQPAAVE